MGEHKGPSDTEGYRFMKETIKNRPVNWKALFRRALFLIGSAALFGAVAALVFSLVYPAAVERMGTQQDDGEKVKIPKDELDATEAPAQEETPTPRVVEVPRQITLED